jgi:peroxiredoxin/predicted negative regulator of RcsB-dependent stress response
MLLSTCFCAAAILWGGMVAQGAQPAAQSAAKEEKLEAPAELMTLSVTQIMEKARSDVAKFDSTHSGADPTLEWCKKLRAFAQNTDKADEAAKARFSALTLAYERGATKEAVAFFREAAEKHPDHEYLEGWMKPLVSQVLTNAPETADDVKDALTLLQRSKSRQVAAAAWFYLGDLQAERGQADEARKSFQKIGSSYSSSIYMGPATQAMSALMNLKEGFPAPNVQLKDLDGQSIDLSTAKTQRPVVVYFWDPTDPSTSFLEELRRIAKELGEQGATFVGVPVAGNKEALQQVFADMPLPGLQADPEQGQALLDAQAAYAVRRTPHVVLIDRAGKLGKSGSPSSIGLEPAVLRLVGLLGPEPTGIDKTIMDYDTKLTNFNRSGRQGRHPGEDFVNAMTTALRSPTAPQADREKVATALLGALLDMDRAQEFTALYGQILQQTKDAAFLGRFVSPYRDLSEQQSSTTWLDDVQGLATGSQTPAVACAAHLTLAEYFIDQNKPEEAQKHIDEVKKVQPDVADKLAGEMKTLAVGQPSPDFTATALDGSSIKLSDLKGNVVVMTFWSTTSPASAKCLPKLKALSTAVSGQSVKLIGVAVDRDPSAVSSAVTAGGVNWPQIVNDAKQNLADTYHVTDLPRVYVIDQKGIIRVRGNPITVDLEKTVKDLLQTAQLSPGK